MTPVLLPQELKTRSLGKLVFLRRERGVWDQLQRQEGLLAGANELLSAQSAEVEDFRLRCADTKVKAATAQEQLAPLAAWVKELEEELTRAASDLQGSSRRSYGLGHGSCWAARGGTECAPADKRCFG